MGLGLVTAVRGIYSELQMSKRGKVLKIEKDMLRLIKVYCLVVNSIIKSILSSFAALFFLIAPHFLHL